MRLKSCIAGLLLLMVCTVSCAAPRPLTVFAAASLKESLDNVEHAWEASGHRKVVISYAASSALAQQIEQGAPADVFIAADNQWMDYLRDRKHILPATRFELVRNSLVLIEPAKSILPSLNLKKRDSLIGVLGDGRLAVGEPSSVPAGIYAKQALQKLGLWDSVSAHLAPADSVRSALEYVANDDAPLGIVYLTDAKAEPRVKVLETFADNTHDPIVYPAARTVSRGDGKEAALFMAFLRGKRASDLFRAAGFVVGS